MLVLGLNGIAMAVWGWIGGLGTLLVKLGMSEAAVASLGISITALIPLILIIIATIALLWIAWQYNWFNIRQTTGVIVHGIANAFFYLVEAGQILLNSMGFIWNGILDAVMLAARPIVDLINGIGAAWAWLNGQDFEPIRLNLDFLKADLTDINKEIDKWQQGVGQAIFSQGDEFIMQGERMNQGLPAERQTLQDITVNIDNKNEAKDTFDYETEAAKIADTMNSLGITGVKYK